MKLKMIAGTVFCSLLAAAPFAAQADTMSGSSMSGHSMAMTMAKCPSADPAVIVNTTKMTYMMDTTANRSAMKGMMAHDKFVCKSSATKMGAKMQSNSMMMHSGKM